MRHRREHDNPTEVFGLCARCIEPTWTARSVLAGGKAEQLPHPLREQRPSWPSNTSNWPSNGKLPVTDADLQIRLSTLSAVHLQLEANVCLSVRLDPRRLGHLNDVSQRTGTCTTGRIPTQFLQRIWYTVRSNARRRVKRDTTQALR